MQVVGQRFETKDRRKIDLHVWACRASFVIHFDTLYVCSSPTASENLCKSGVDLEEL